MTTKYPNLLAEYEAAGWHVLTWALRANITQDLMKEVLYSGAELTPEEIKNIGEEFGNDYIASPELTLIDIDDKIRRMRLDEFIKWFNGTPAIFTDSVQERDYAKAAALADAYLSGKPLSMAIYRAGMGAKTYLEQALKPKSAPRGSKFAEKPVVLPAGHKTRSGIQIVEYQSNRVLTTQQLATAYGADAKNIHDNFANNKNRFIAGRDYHLLQGEELKSFKTNYPDIIGLVSKHSPHLYLWTERGANRHCKILDTDQAWKQFDILEETYFRVKNGTIPTPTAAPPQKSYRKSSDTKQIESEAKLNNSRARIARELAKIADRPEVTVEYKKILYTHATAALTGKLDNIKEALQ